MLGTMPHSAPLAKPVMIPGAPKFSMPVIQAFLLRHSYFTGNEPVHDFVKLTLRKMAYGGIYDQAGGGFARYSTDSRWKVPHFEKMLYDNAQLISLYSEAYQAFGDHLYKEIAEETIQFVFREMASPEGAFYSSLDADSEGEEGKYYTWDISEFNQILGNHASLIRKYYHIGGQGHWESGRNILLRTLSPEEFSKEQGLHPSAFKTILKSARAKMLKTRAKRTRPALDNKFLTSWNGMMLKGLCDAYRVSGKKEYLNAGMDNARFLLSNLMEDDGRLFHCYNYGKASINGFLEDYCFLAEGLLSLYQVTFDENYLLKARLLAGYAIEHFYDQESGMFFLTSSLDPPLIAKKHEIYDNVIPSSNSSMARVLFLLGAIFEKEDFVEISERMIAAVKDHALKHPSAFANWGSVMLGRAYPFYTVVITGPECLEKAAAMQKKYHPDVFFCGSETESELQVFKDRIVKDETMIYVCSGKECKLPTALPEEAELYFSQSHTKGFTENSEK